MEQGDDFVGSQAFYAPRDEERELGAVERLHEAETTTTQDKAMEIEAQQNIRALALSLALFGSFACVQMTFAYISHSLALLGDSSTMMVDAFTYGLNLYAEKQKVKLLGQKGQPKDRLVLEVYIPLVSAVTLTVVVALILKSALANVVNRTSDNDVNESTAAVFATLNLTIDVVCVLYYIASGIFKRYLPASCFVQPAVENANIYSALTHLAADTLRSVTVLLGSLFSAANPSVSSNMIDSVAALIVGLVILLMTVPLFRSLYNRYVQLSLETSM